MVSRLPLQRDPEKVARERSLVAGPRLCSTVGPATVRRGDDVRCCDNNVIDGLEVTGEDDGVFVQVMESSGAAA